MEITSSSKQLTEQDINALEERWGRSIPSSYRKFLLEHNGGRPSISEFTMTRLRDQKTDIGAIKTFLGINTSEETFGLDYILSTFQDRIPNYMFPVARDPGGNLICILAKGKDSGKVYFWDHEYEPNDDQASTIGNLYFIADNFDDFISNLR